jgi:hypothetical protein
MLLQQSAHSRIVEISRDDGHQQHRARSHSRLSQRMLLLRAERLSVSRARSFRVGLDRLDSHSGLLPAKPVG